MCGTYGTDPAYGSSAIRHVPCSNLVRRCTGTRRRKSHPASHQRRHMTDIRQTTAAPRTGEKSMCEIVKHMNPRPSCVAAYNSSVLRAAATNKGQRGYFRRARAVMRTHCIHHHAIHSRRNHVSPPSSARGSPHRPHPASLRRRCRQPHPIFISEFKLTQQRSDVSGQYIVFLVVMPVCRTTVSAPEIQTTVCI